MGDRRKNLDKIFPGTGQWDAELKIWAKTFHMSIWESDGIWIVSQAEGDTHFKGGNDPIKTLQVMAGYARTKKSGDWVSKTFGRNCMMELCLIFNLKIYDERYVE